MNVESKRIYGIDLLRFLAAIAVVFFHYFCYYPGAGISQSDGLRDFAQYGFLGVELFFMISGFVILYSIRGKDWKQFARSRFIRIYPTLWLGATLTFFGLLLFGAVSKEPTIWQYLANLTLFHRFIFNQAHLDGVYWTLTVELRFYVLIGVLLAFGWLTPRKLRSVLIVWSLIGIGYLFVGKQANFLVYGCYFAAGVGFYYLWLEGENWRNILFLVFTFIACLISVCLKHTEPELSPWILIMAISVFFLIFYLLVCGFNLPIPNRILTTLGGITYPLYLIHQELGYSLLLHLPMPGDFTTKALLLTAAFTLLAWIIYKCYEPIAHQRVGLLWDRVFSWRVIDNSHKISN